MWTTSAIALAGATILGLFMLSLVVARRDTFDEIRDLYDLRVVRRAARSLGQFGLGTLMWLTAYIAVMIPVIQTMGGFSSCLGAGPTRDRHVSACPSGGAVNTGAMRTTYPTAAAISVFR